MTPRDFTVEPGELERGGVGHRVEFLVRAGERIGHLRQAPAGWRWVTYWRTEPRHYDGEKRSREEALDDAAWHLRPERIGDEPFRRAFIAQGRLCRHGQKQRWCEGCLEWTHVCPGMLPHVCGGGAS